jgi:quercetin dioxygenase-like cupin family protein
MSKVFVEDPVGRQRLSFEQVEDENGTEVLLVEDWVGPGGDVPPHVHPEQEERFLILTGEIEFIVGRERRRLGPGQTIVVPPGKRHAFRNVGAGETHMRVRVRPARDLQEFLEASAALGREGHIARFGPLRVPKRPSSVVRVAQMLRRHRENTVILMPPPLVQRVALDPLARLAERGC